MNNKYIPNPQLIPMIIGTIFGIFIVFLATKCVYADEAFVGYGLGVFRTAEPGGMAQTKTFNLGFRKMLNDGVYWQNTAGAIGEGSPDRSRKSMGVFSSGLGVKVCPGPFEFRSGWGLAVLTNHDSQLGGIFPQFRGDGYFGVRDNKGYGVGVDYFHLSSSGIVMPNAGKDFFTLEISKMW